MICLRSAAVAVAAVSAVLALSGCGPDRDSAPSVTPSSSLRLGEPCSQAQIGQTARAVAIDGTVVDVVCRISASDGGAIPRWYLPAE